MSKKRSISKRKISAQNKETANLAKQSATPIICTFSKTKEYIWR